MLYALIDRFFPWFDEHGMGFLRLFRYVEFRTILSFLLSFSVVLLCGERVIRALIRMKVGDNPEFYNKTLNEITKDKGNTPTMGGVLIAAAILAPTLLLADLRNFYIAMALLCLVWLTLLGGADDYLKLTNRRRKTGSREGLYSWEKLVFQLGLAIVLGLFIHKHGREAAEPLNTMSFSLNLPFMKTWIAQPGSPITYQPSPDLIKLAPWPFAILTILVITGSSNAVNLTDGMDGLAGGIMSIVGLAFTILCLLAGSELASKYLLVPYIEEADELAIVTAAITGSCVGFLWFNCHPAQIFMGDTGSLPLGGLIGYIAVVVRQEFLLFIIGGVFVLEAISVMLQVGYFKYSRRKFGEGRRIFRMAPIHHHFHLGGLQEQKVVVRLWLATALLVALALLTIKIR